MQRQGLKPCKKRPEEAGVRCGAQRPRPSRGRAPPGTAHPGADRHPPPTTGSRQPSPRALHIAAAGKPGGGEHRQQELPCQGFRGPGSLGKGTNKFPAFQAQQSKMTASSVIIPARPPLFHRRWWPGTPNTRGSGMGATSSFSGASPDVPAAHSYLLQRAACCPCCGGMLWAEGSLGPRLPGRWLCEHPSNKET